MTDLTIEGARDLIKNLDTLKDEVIKNLKKAIQEVAEAMKNDAVLRAPVGETGILSDNIIKQVQVKVAKGVVVAVIGVKKGDAYYGYFVHEGTKKIKVKQPFLIHAVNKFQGELLEKIKKAVLDHVH